MQYFNRIQDPIVNRAFRDVVDEVNRLNQTAADMGTQHTQSVQDLQARVVSLETLVTQLKAQLTPTGTIISP